MEITAAIEKYLNGITTDEFHRYKSWDNCHKSFNVSTQTSIHVLELAFYLASWGMYRGSSGLLQKNHLIHKGAVDILFSKEGQKLQCNSKNEISKSDINNILNLKNKLANHYKNIKFKKGAEEEKSISPTNTLLSKILLGTLGCLPAYDRYFIDGLRERKIKNKTLNRASLNELFDFIELYEIEIDNAQKFVMIKIQQHYPKMKILDMYFWQIGYDKFTREKKENKKLTKENHSL